MIDDLRLPTRVLKPNQRLWEVFHENSKNFRLPSPSAGWAYDQLTQSVTTNAKESYDLEEFRSFQLPKPDSVRGFDLWRAIVKRASVRQLVRSQITLEQISALLYAGYGVTRISDRVSPAHTLRTTPSAGALFPIEIFLQTECVRSLPSGIFHYNPLRHRLGLLRKGDFNSEVRKAVVISDFAADPAVSIFLTAVFERSAIKYRERAYRFVAIEAGHIAQNMNLVATALGLASVNVGGFYDDEINDMLDLDGVTHAAFYVIMCGKRRATPETNGS